MIEDWKKIKVSLKNGDTECYVNVPFVDLEGKLETPLAAEDVRKALTEAGVTSGVRADLIAGLFEDGRFDQEVLVAEGTPAKDGREARIEYYFDYKHEFQPKEDEDGRIDYHEVSIFVNVAKGDELCRLYPPTEGEPGETVTGQPIEPRNGRDRLLPQGLRTEVSHPNKEVLIRIFIQRVTCAVV